jgi:hypothetical protein
MTDPLCVCTEVQYNGKRMLSTKAEEERFSPFLLSYPYHYHPFTLLCYPYEYILTTLHVPMVDVFSSCLLMCVASKGESSSVLGFTGEA